MKTKGISGLEANVEKLVVGVFVVLLVLVVLWQIVLVRPTVQVGTTDVRAGDAYTEVERQAEAVEGQMNDLRDVSGFVDPTPTTDPQTLFASSSVVPAEQIGFALGSSLRSTLGEEVFTTTQASRYAEIQIPAVAQAAASTNQSTIDPIAVVRQPALADYVDPDQPDLFSVSVEARFDGTALATLLESKPDNPDTAPIPQQWYLGKMVVLAVELERQQRMPDGSWSPETLVTPMPGATTLTEQIAAISTPGDLQTLLDQARTTETMQQVLTPAYYPVWLGQPWTPPTEQSGPADEKQDPRTKALRDQIDRLTRQIDSFNRRITKAGGDPAGQPPEDKPVLKRVYTQRDEAQSELDDAQAELDELTGQGEGATDTQAQPIYNPLGDDPQPLLKNEALPLLAHDVTVDRGATYRYRIRISVVNPYFSHAANLSDEQKSLAEPVVLRSAPGEWSVPVQIDQPSYFFVTTATQPNELSPIERATAELFTFEWGYWRRGTARMTPGDRVAAQASVPDYTRFAQARATEDNEDDDAELPEQAPVSPVDMSNPSVFLSVAQSLSVGLDAASLDVFLAQPSGSVVRRSPATDKQRDVYSRLSASADAAEQAPKPE